jgi:hypothetical protein
VVSAIDARQMALVKGKVGADKPAGEDAAKAKKPERELLSVYDEFLWRPIA